MKKNLQNVVTTVILLLIPYIIFAQPNLRSTSSFALFTAAGAFNNLGNSMITGDIGTDVGALTGFPPGTVNGGIYDETSPVSEQAAIDVALAYGELSEVPYNTVLITPLGNGQILTPGVYYLGGAASLNGNLTLDAQGDPNAVFIIKVNGAFSTSTFSNIFVINSANFCNVYWHINGAFALGDFSVFRGTVLANGAISLLEGSSLFGRGLTQMGAISTHNIIFTSCGCTAPPLVSITQTNVDVCGTPAANFNYTVANGPTTTFTSNGTGTLSLSSLPNGTSMFTYTPSPEEATTGAVVTITATIADPDGVGPCVASTDNATVTIRVPANAGTATAPATVCDNSTATIDLFSLLTGEQASGTWTRTTGTGGIFDSDEATFTPAAGATSSTFTYTVTGIGSCLNDMEQVTVNVNASPDLAAITAQSNICPTTTFDLASLSIVDNNNTTGVLSYYNTQADAANETNGIASTVSTSGTYYIRKETAQGCFDIVSVMVNIIPCASCPPTMLSANINTNCATSGSVTILITNGGSGSSIIGNITNGTTDYPFSGTTLADGTATIIINNISVSGTYTIENISIAGSLCLATGSGSAVITLLLIAGQDGSIEACNNQTALVNLSDLITGENIGGTWNLQIGSPDPGIKFTAANGTLDVNNLAAGTYNFVYTVLNPDPCPSDEAVATVVVYESVLVNAGTTQTSCATKPVNLTTIGASISGGATMGIWSTSGDGTFTGGTAFGSATAYVAGANDRQDGTVTLTLTSIDPAGPCEAVSATVLITILNVDCGGFPWDGGN